METKQVIVGGRTLNVVDQGIGHPVLFVHGFPLDHRMWRNQFTLADRFRVIVPDLSGFGASPPNKNPVSMQTFADELAELLDCLSITQPVTYCGLSMGGYIGWQFWKRHANRLANLVACNTRAAKDTAQVSRARKISAQSVRKTGSEPVADLMIEKLFYQPDQIEKQDIVQSTRRVIAQTDPESIAQGQLAMANRSDATQWLSKISVPTLFVVGEYDSITPPSEMRSNAKAVSDSTFFEIKGAGHLAPLEKPKVFNAGLLDFIDSI